MSSTGTYAIAVTWRAVVAGIYYSSNNGQSWTQSTSATANQYGSCALSSTGQYGIVGSVNTGTGLWYTNNYGVTWLQTTTTGYPSTGQWGCVAMSSTGTYAVAGCTANSSNGYLWYSSNNGQTWTQATLTGVTYTTNHYWRGISMSSTGQYCVASGHNNSTYVPMLWYSSNYGQTWTQVVNYSTDNVNLAMSSTGQYVLGSSIAISNTFGVSWSQLVGTTLPGTVTNFNDVAISANGQYAIGVTGPVGLYVLNNGNQTISYPFYTSISTSSFGQATYTSYNTATAFSCITISSAGQYIAAGSYSGVFCSTAFGTGAGYNPQTGIWYSYAMSSTGQYTIAGTSAGIYYSYNYGTTPVAITSTTGAPSTGSIYAVAISSTGQYGLAGISGYGLWYTSTFGQTWAIASGPATNMNSYGVAMSSTGQYCIATSQSNVAGIWVSSNYGQTWTICNTTGAPSTLYWTGIAMSSTGQYAVAGAYTGNAGLWYSSNYGQTWTICGTTGPPSTATWSSISMSSSGQYVAAVSANTASMGIWYSNTYGQSWYKTTTTGFPSTGTWVSVAVSSNGQYVAACSSSTGGYYIQNNSAQSLSYTNILGYTGFGPANATPKALIEVNGTGGFAGGGVSYSMYMAGSLLVGTNMVSSSDKRIKSNISDVVDVSALSVFRSLKPKRYNYIDTRSRGTAPVWGFIAQEVAENMQYAVNKTNEFIPNIYKDVTIVGNKVTLPENTPSLLAITNAQYDASGNLIVTDSTGSITITDEYTLLSTDDAGNSKYVDPYGAIVEVDASSNIVYKESTAITTAALTSNASGNPIRLKFIDPNNNVIFTSLVSIIDERSFYVEDQLGLQYSSLFLYGQEVEDFNALDKLAIFTVATAALQEVDAELQATKQEVTDLKSQLSAVMQRLDAANI